MEDLYRVLASHYTHFHTTPFPYRAMTGMVGLGGMTHSAKNRYDLISKNRITGLVIFSKTSSIIRIASHSDFALNSASHACWTDISYLSNVGCDAHHSNEDRGARTTTTTTIRGEEKNNFTG